MGSYIGKKPTDVPLTSSDINDDIITSSKIVDGTIVPADLHNDAKVVKSGSAPTSPVEGNLWYDTATDALKVYDTTAGDWVKIVKTDAVLTSVTASNLIVRS